MSSAALGARYVLAVDVGGTFTDVIRHDTETGAVEIAKTASTPPDFIDGMLAGIDAVGAKPRDIKLIKIGTTIATNTVIMRTGARTALVTTAGFTDVLHAARAARPTLYDFRLGPGARACRPARHDDRRPAHDLRRRGAGAARRGGLARHRGAAPRARRRGGGGELPPQLHQRRPRAPRAGNPGRRDAGQLRLPLLRHPARDPRVRAHQHDRRQRLSRPGAGALSRSAPRAPGRHRLRRVGPDHPFRRRRHVY